MLKFDSQKIKNMPWEDCPEGFEGPVWRYSKNPIIDRNPIKGITRIFNSAVVYWKDEYYGIFRAEDISTLPNLRFGKSKDGINWEYEDHTLWIQDEEGNPVYLYYAYDPRITKIDDVFHITFCCDFYGPTVGLITTTDFKKFVLREKPFIPYNRNGVLFPRKFNGCYKILSRASDNGHTPFGDIFSSDSPDLVYWGRHRHVMERGGVGWWQGTKIGAGPTPIETEIGWIMLYHGVCNTCNGYVYSMGAAILDKDEPSKVLYRSRDYILTPEAPYEETGFVPNVVFPCSTLVNEDGRVAIYYGAADSYVALGFTTIDRLVDFIINHNEKVGRDNEIGK